MSGLFRQQVVERQADRLHGEILLLPRFSHSLMLGILIVWVIALIVWLVTGSYARKESVEGWLEPASGMVRVYADRAGIVKQVFVREGEKVRKGQPLFVVNGDRVLEGGDHLESILLSEYESQKKILSEQLTSSEKIYLRQKEDLNQRIAASQQELELLNKQVFVQSERFGIVSEQAERFQSLRSRGHISTSELESVTAQVLELENERQILERTRVSLKNQIQRLENEKSLLPIEYTNDVAQLRTRLSDLAQQIAQLSGQRAYVVKATKSGLVNNLQIREGQQAQVGLPVLTLVPEGQSLKVQLLVPVRAAGFVENGQSLNIRYDAFPYQKFGLYSGSVLEVSGSVILPEELINSPVALREPAFMVTAELRQPAVSAYGKTFPLKAGMTLTADIELAERTLLQWLLEPVLSLKGRL